MFLSPSIVDSPEAIFYMALILFIAAQIAVAAIYLNIAVREQRERQAGWLKETKEHWEG